MDKRFIQLTSGWIPVFVLLLLAAALAMGQGSSDAPGERVHLATPATSNEAPGLLDANDRAKLESIRIFVDSFLPMPESIQITVDTTIDTGAGGAQPQTGPGE